MSTKVIMPQMGESIFEGTITKWLKKVGDTINRDEPLFEISTDKVDSEIPSPASGVVSEILFPEGSVVQINTVVAVINGEQKAAGAQPDAAPAAAPKAPPVQSEKPAPAAEAPPAPAPAEKPAPAAPPPPAAPKPGTPAPESAERAEPMPEETPAQAVRDSKPLREAERQVAAAQEGTPRRESAPPPAEPAPATKPAAPADERAAEVRTSPLVRRLAREHNIDLSQVQGTGLDGRVTRQDVMSYIEQAQADAAPPPEQPAAQAEQPEPPAPQPEKAAPPQAAPAPPPQAQAATVAPPPAPEPPRFYGESETVAMTPMRKAIAEHMVLSKRTSAHVNTIFEVDMTSIVRLREQHQAEFTRREGVKLTFTPFFVKALVETVREFPVLNCSISGDTIVYKKPVNVGIAVALDWGLIVPVVKDAHLKSFTGLALTIQDLAERARTKRLKPDDVQNGTISITNPGVYGGLFGTPIINQPQVAILGIGGIEKRPVVIDDAIAIRSLVYLSLSFDHRAIDGAVADQAMAKLKQRLQSWSEWID